MMLQSCISDEDLSFYCSVIVLCAGGTINMGGNRECKPAGGVQKALDSIKSRLDEMDISFEFETLFHRPPDSSNVGENEWKVIVSKISEVIEKKEDIKKRLLQSGIKREVGGIVVAHGTDTLHITSLVVALEFSIRTLTIPVVFTASHSTIDAIGSDAPNNLLKSIYATKERFSRKENLAPGVYVLIGQDIHLASRLTKVYTTPNDDGKYFYSFPSPVGQITSAKSNSFHFRVDNNYLSGLVKSEHAGSAELNGNKPWGLVEHIFLDKFISPRTLEDLERRVHHYRSQQGLQSRSIGIVIQGDFKNNRKFQEIASLLHKIDESNVIILIGSRQTFLELQGLGQWRNLGLIPKSLSHLKAKIKLGWLLKSDISSQRVLQLMEVNIAGEIFITDILPEWIRFETFPNCIESTEVVIAYPNIHPKVLEDAVKRLESCSNSRKKQLYLYGFGDGHFPASNTSIAQLVNIFTQKHWDVSANIDENVSLDDILKALNQYIKRYKERIASYFEDHYDIISADEQKKLIAKYVRTELKTKMRNEIQEKITSVFAEGFTHPGVNISISEASQNELASFAVDKIKITVSKEIIDEKIDTLYKSNPDLRPIRHVFLLLAENYPETISKRIIKESVMASNDNMKAIGHAVDRSISVFAKTLAVRSKSNIAKYETGNMLMVLGVDSDLTRGFRTDFFFPKQNL